MKVMINASKAYLNNFIVSNIFTSCILSYIVYYKIFTVFYLKLISTVEGYGLTIQQGLRALDRLGIKVPEEVLSTSHYAFSSSGEILGA
jgi:hypothetical protein